MLTPYETANVIIAIKIRMEKIGRLALEIVNTGTCNAGNKDKYSNDLAHHTINNDENHLRVSSISIRRKNATCVCVGSLNIVKKSSGPKATPFDG